MTEDDYIEINLDQGMIGVGILGGVVASLWAVLPFVLPGIGNLWFITLPVGLVAVALLERNKLLRAVGITALTFAVISFLLVPAGAGMFAGEETEEGTEVEEVQVKEAQKVAELSLPGMFCPNCANNAERTLEGMDGVTQAEVSLAEERALVVYNPEVITPEEMVEHEVLQGYDASVETADRETDETAGDNNDTAASFGESTG